jgi:hypothetical protein
VNVRGCVLKLRHVRETPQVLQVDRFEDLVNEFEGKYGELKVRSLPLPKVLAAVLRGSHPFTSTDLLPGPATRLLSVRAWEFPINVFPASLMLASPQCGRGAGGTLHAEPGGTCQ